MSHILKELKHTNLPKRIDTTIEYKCKTDEDKEAVYSMVHDMLENHLEEFAKVTYDLEPDNVVKVEVIENR